LGKTHKPNIAPGLWNEKKNRVAYFMKRVGRYRAREGKRKRRIAQTARLIRKGYTPR
jgi:hypothetical protein